MLLVEDEADLAEPIVRLLEREGHQVSAVRSVNDARQLEPDSIEIVLLDVMLPEGEDAGFLFARELREAGYRGKLLFLTARHTAHDRLRSVELGADGYLLKPFGLRDLLARLREFTSA